ncbi:hypothetical protein D3C72_1722230 [compost metagenome]
MHFVLRQRIDDVGHAGAGIGRVARIRVPAHHLAERFERLLGRLLVALGQVLPREGAEQPQVVVEVDQTLEVVSVIQGGAGRMQTQETVQHGQGLRLFAGLVVGVGLVELGLLGQRGACGTAFELLVQRHGLVEVARVALVLRLGVYLVGAPAHGVVHWRAGAAREGDCGAQRAQ